MWLLSTTTAPGTLLPGGTGHSFSLPRWSGDHSSAVKGACLGLLCQPCIKLKEERDRKGSEVGRRKRQTKKRQLLYLSPQRAVEDLGVQGGSGSFPCCCSEQLTTHSQHDRVPRTPSHLVVSALVLQGPEIPGDQVRSKDFFLLLLFFSK